MQDIQKLNLQFQYIIDKTISKGALSRAENAINLQQFDNNKARLDSGIDVNNKKIRKLKNPYSKWKKRYIGNKVNHRKDSIGKKWYNLLYETTEWKAKSVPNYGRLTGKTLSSIVYESTVRILKNGIKITLWTYSNSKLGRNISEGLAVRYNRFYYGGLAKPTGTTGKKEAEKIADLVAKYLNIKRIK